MAPPLPRGGRHLERSRSLLPLVAALLLAIGDPSPAPPTVTADTRDGFTLRSADGRNRLRIGGYAHFDGRFFGSDESGAATDTFLLRRLRPSLAGTVGRFDFAFVSDFGSGTAVVQDGWAETRLAGAARLRAGKFKAPVGLERLTAATSLLFVERAFPTSLLPNRDVGLQLHGETAGGRLAWQAGVFNGVPDGGSGDLDAADAKDLAARVWAQPFRARARSPLKGLGLGFAATTGRQTGNLPVYRTSGQATVFSYATGVTADGAHRRYSPQGSYTGGPVRLMVEHARSTSSVRRGAAVDEVTLTAWQVAGGLLVRGGTNTWGLVERDGAVELAARFAALDADDAVFALGLADPARSISAARELAVGVNWWVTRSLKYVVDVSRTTFDGGAAAGADRSPENALMMRVQVAF
jgi:phosphate-selective porin OprO and OprP